MESRPLIVRLNTKNLAAGDLPGLEADVVEVSAHEYVCQLLQVKRVSLVLIENATEFNELLKNIKIIRNSPHGLTIPILVKADARDDEFKHLLTFGSVEFSQPSEPNWKYLARIHLLVELHELRSRNAARIAARATEERFRLIVDSIPQGVWRTDSDGSADYFSQRFTEMLPCDTSNFLGWGWTTPIHAEDLSILVAEWQRCRKLAIPVSVEFRLRADSGEYFWFLSQGRPFFNDAGDIVNYYGTWTNIHEQKRASIELQEAKLNAEKANELKSAFLANMSHEIRTPLGAMLGFADLLRDPEVTDEERRGYVEILHRNGVQLGHIINDILDLSKVETGHLSFERITVSPHQIATETLALFGPRANEKGIELRLRSEPSTPSTIVSDPVRIRQILDNVVGNAIKFTEAGTISVRICGREETDGRVSAVFEVTDTGIGIAEENRGNLFKVFTQADNSITRRYGGTGLGLALSKRLAEALGGKLELVKSAPNDGSTFCFSVESVAAKTNERVGARLAPAALREEALKGLSVLVVEDARDNQKLIDKYLRRAGAEVEFANNGREGVSKAIGGTYDVVLMDIQMPVLDGYAAASELRSRGYGQPIVALTAHAMADARERCLAAGFTDYLPKPISTEQLVAKILLRCQSV